MVRTGTAVTASRFFCRITVVLLFEFVKEYHRVGFLVRELLFEIKEFENGIHVFDLLFAHTLR